MSTVWRETGLHTVQYRVPQRSLIPRAWSGPCGGFRADLQLWIWVFLSTLDSDLSVPFRSLAHAHPSAPSALLSLTLAPWGLSLSYFLRPPHLTTPPDPTPPHPHQRFLAGRFVFICNLTFSFLLRLKLPFIFFLFAACFCLINSLTCIV